jgi:hypothetical protein
MSTVTKPTQPTAPTDLARINTMYYEMADLVQYLYGRWLDEGQYEDIADYGNVIAKALEKHNFTLVAMKKKPFGFTFKISESSPEYTIKVTTTKYQWLRTN